jgi:hypothetical protein
MKATAIALLLLVSVTAACAAEAAEFYVDPDWQGPWQGTAARPWPSLWDTGAWAAINSALATSDVTVYFSARGAGSDTDETTTTGIPVRRTEASTHRLTLDGMSRYNTSDTSPSWLPYAGSSRFHLTCSYPVNTDLGVLRSYVTVRGFKLESTNGQCIYWWGGNGVTLEDNECWFSGAPSVGPAIIFDYAYRTGGGGNGGCSNLTIQRNRVHHTYYEGIYIGGCENAATPAHHDGILVADNVVFSCGAFGGEGDGIDIKDGCTSVTVKGNTVHDCPQDGITTHSAALIDGNTCYGNGRAGICYNDFWGKTAHTGCIIMNNVCYGNAWQPDSWGANITVGSSSGGVGITSPRLYNNTSYGSSRHGIFLTGSAISGADVRNNLSFSNASGYYDFRADADVCALHDYNCYWRPAGGVYYYAGAAKTAAALPGAEPHSLGADPLVLDSSTGNFALSASSPCRNTGAAITANPRDRSGVARPQGPAWDMGAFEFAPPRLPPAPPTGVMAIPQ